MKQDIAIREAEVCRERREVARCAECEERGASNCVWDAVDFGPPRKPAAQRREETIEERVRRLFASA